MKRVFVLGNYLSKAHYRKYMKIIRNLEKNYIVISLIDMAKDSNYNERDIQAIKECDYIVAYITGAISNTYVAFLSGYAAALNKPLIIIISDYAKDLDILHFCTAYLLYSETIGISKSIILEEVI